MALIYITPFTYIDYSLNGNIREVVKDGTPLEAKDAKDFVDHVVRAHQERGQWLGDDRPAFVYES